MRGRLSLFIENPLELLKKLTAEMIMEPLEKAHRVGAAGKGSERVWEPQKLWGPRFSKIMGPGSLI